MKKNKVFLLVLSILVQLVTNAQNLIPNGSFEEFKKTDNPYAPKILKNLDAGWEAFTNTISRIYEPSLFVEKNNNIIQEGDVFLIFCNFQAVKNRQFTKTFFQVPLTKTLVKDSLYNLSYFYQLRVQLEKVMEDSIVDSRLLQFCFIDSKLNNLEEIDLLKKENLSDMIPQGRSFQSYKIGKWYSRSIIYKAKGGEKYFLFGIIGNDYTKYWCSIYFDNISLILTDKILPDISNQKIGSSFVMDNILFETDKSILKESSYNSLNQLIVELNKNTKLKLEISGHTDNVGTGEHNLKLSEQRAKAVVDYLIQYDIDKKRLSYKGYGSSKPITDNDNENGRAENRRVEVTILDK